MASNMVFRFGPVQVQSNYTQDILAPGAISLGTNSTNASPYNRTYIVLRHIRVINKGASAATFRFYIGASATSAIGTEFMGYDYSVAVGSAFDWYGQLRLGSGDFLVGGASLPTSLVIQGEGEVGIGL